MKGSKVTELFLKAEQLSIQKGIKTHGDNGKKSVMKEIKNLEVKNNCFREIDYQELTQ